MENSDEGLGGIDPAILCVRITTENSMSTKRLKKLQLVKTAEGSSPERTPGKVTHDARGNAVWDWDIDTGVLSRKSVEELLTTLDAPGTLSLDSESEPKASWAGDPYNRTR
jgi:hypothetical protein